MFSIPYNIEIVGLESTGCSRGHIKQCISDKKLREAAQYTYFGKTVSKGTIVLHTSNGDMLLTFDEKNGWARSVSIKKIESEE